ncbi:MAG: LamG-like jellyroll fold domain-containing protein [Blastopirellula sp. JB062]
MTSTARFDELLSLMLDDVVTEAEMKELVAFAASDEAKLAQLKQHLVLSDRLSQYEDIRREAQRYYESLQTRMRAASQGDAFIHNVLQSKEATDRKPEPRRRGLVSRQVGLGIACAIAATLLIGLISWPIWRSDPTEESPLAAGSIADASQGEARDQGVAVLTRMIDVQGANGANWREGATLAPQSLVWDQGLLQLEFYSGATVVVEGPASLEILDASRVHCNFGKLRAHIPESAQGFVILAPTLELVDLGTEFGMDISSDGTVDVQVFEGVVELYEINSDRKQESRRELTAGKAISISPDGSAQPLNAQKLKFTTPNELARLTDTQSQKRLQSWKERRTATQQDPRIVAYFPFDRDAADDRSLIGYAPSGEKIIGAIVGAQWAEGRWPGKSSLQFKRPGDRVRLLIPGAFDSLTYSAWIRLDGLDRRFNSLLLTDSFDANQPHWQIHQVGHLILGVRDPGVIDTHDYRSPPIFRLQDLGQWVHLATVYDAHEKQVKHYVNGQLVSSEPFQDAAHGKLTIENATIGNWSPTKKEKASRIRNLNGSIDELTVYQSALDGAEIAEIYEKGRP